MWDSEPWLQLHLLALRKNGLYTCYSSSAKRSFSKLKLIKSYLRSTMSQEKLSGLVILSIENEMLKELEYKNLISQFAYQKVRKINFK